MPWQSGDSLNSGNLNRRSGLIFSATDPAYSADTTGTNDSAASLRAQFAAAAAAGGAAYIPTGIYRVDSLLTLHDQLLVYGDGPGRSILQAGSAHTSAILTNGSGVSDMAVESLELDGNRGSRSTGGNLLHFTVGSGSTIQNVRVANVYAHHSPDLGIILTRVDGGVVDGCHVSNNSRDGITCYFTSRNIRIVNNHIHDCGDDHVGLNAENDTSSGNSMLNIVVANNVLGPGGFFAGDGVAVRGVQGAVIQGNIIREGFASGVGVSNWNTTPSRDVIVSDNIILDTGLGNSGSNGYGVSVVGGRGNSSVSGSEGCYNTTIARNIIDGSRTYGVRALASNSSGTVQWLKILDNTISCGTLNTGNRGIVLDTGMVIDVDIAGNSIYSAQAQGIFLNTSSAATYRRVVISENRVMNSGVAGGTVDAIDIRTTQEVSVRNNFISGSDTRFGIRYSGVSDAIQITNNYIVGNVTSAYSAITGPPTTHVIQGNLGDTRFASIRTLAASALTASAGGTNVVPEEMVFVIGGTSGASLAIRSAGTIWIFNSAASAAQV